MRPNVVPFFLTFGNLILPSFALVLACGSPSAHFGRRSPSSPMGRLRLAGARQRFSSSHASPSAVAIAMARSLIYRMHWSCIRRRMGRACRM